MTAISQPFQCNCQLQREDSDQKFGLYFLPSILPREYQNKNLKLPIENIDYNIEITDNIAKTTITQTYINPSSQFISSEYIFPVSSDACFHSFEAQFNNGKKVKGVVKEKQQAKQEFQEHKQKGNTVALQEISEDSPDVMRLELANIQGNSTVKIEIQFIEELKACMNKFYSFKLKQKMTPRHCSASTIYRKPEFGSDGSSQLHKNCVQNLKMHIKASDTIEMLKVPSHEVYLVQGQNEATIAAMNINFDKDFDFYYGSQHINKPHIVLSQNGKDNQICAQLTFLPNLQTLSVDDALSQYLQDSKTYEFDINSAPAEFLFILDRSGSMWGKRIEQAKKALQVFLQSLPQNSKFNIYSYGSNWDPMFPYSVPYDDEHLNLAQNTLNGFEADYGGNDEYPPMKAAFESPQDKNLPKIVFFLTDGDIVAPKQVIQLLRKKIKTTRLHTIGIGSGCSDFFVKELAAEGKGQSIFIQDSEDMTEKIINVLQSSLSPTLTDVSLQYDKNLVESVTPNPDKMPVIFKNTPFTVNIFFKPGLSLANIQNTPIYLQYFDSTLQQNLQHMLSINNYSYKAENDYLYKLAIFKQIKALERNIDNPELHLKMNNDVHAYKNYKKQKFSCKNNHKLSYMGLNHAKIGHMVCDLCNVYCVQNNVGSFRCQTCDFDTCENCMKQNFLQCSKGHQYEYFSIYSDRIQYLICDLCQKNALQQNCGSFRCQTCDFDTCENCFNKLTDFTNSSQENPEDLKQETEGETILDDIYFAKLISVKEEIQNLSIKHQVLSTQTAFICVINELSDAQSQQYMQQKEIDVQIEKQRVKEIGEDQLYNQNSMISFDDFGGRSSIKQKQKQCSFNSFNYNSNKNSLCLENNQNEDLLDCFDDFSCQQSYQAPPKQMMNQNKQKGTCSFLPSQPQSMINQSGGLFGCSQPQPQSMPQGGSLFGGGCFQQQQQQQQNNQSPLKSHSFKGFSNYNNNCNNNNNKQKPDNNYLSCMNSILQKQKCFGQWEFDSVLLQELNMTKGQFKKFQKSIQNQDVLMTMLVLYWLEKKCQDKKSTWNLIRKKAESWLNSQMKLQNAYSKNLIQIQTAF